MMIRAARLSLLLVVLAGCTRAAATGAPAAATLRTDADTPPMFVVVVRHAERAPEPANDPVLSEAGIARAAALDSALRRLPVTDVVVSQLQRTRLTAAAFIARTNATVHVVPIGAAGVPAHVQAVADTVRAIARTRGRGGVLVVGHSNTVTPIVAALGGGTAAPLCDSQYSQLFTLQEQASGIVRGERSTYGAADPADPSCAPSAPGMLPRP
ncbi:MAG TPA: histidine phosphatase family protein [Gemmatimonadaceae bacterium]|nr:histidine phosphatase family protein [Gemmatimonadaceae bacterium]